VPVLIVQSEHDEFIRREHAEYLARTIPDAEFIALSEVSHFAPLQRPEQFNTAMLEFVGKVLPGRSTQAELRQTKGPVKFT
jgi:pimeloyl-ACP methyl ester carboxylesterase